MENLWKKFKKLLDKHILLWYNIDTNKETTYKEKRINNMKSSNEWRIREENLTELKNERAELERKIKELKEKIKEYEDKKKDLSKQIHLTEVGIRQHNNKHKEHKTNTDTEVYKMFGKPLKELTEEEYRKYYNARQRINRQKRKERQSA